jgi:hypothetical protein
MLFMRMLIVSMAVSLSRFCGGVIGHGYSK